MRVVVENVTARFGDVTALENFSCEIRGDALVALAGPSGSGKTTLLAMLAGALRPTSGRVRFVDASGPMTLPPSMAWVSQASNTLPDRTAAENVAIGALARGLTAAEADEEAARWLNELGLSHRSESPARLLSGGEQQRLAFARALAADAELILADEPTANLDEANTRLLVARLRDLARDRCIVVATHDPLVIAECDDTIALRTSAALLIPDAR